MIDSTNTMLQDQHAVVVGGSSGIGFATARAFLDAGARVTMVARDEAKLSAAAKRLASEERVATATAGDALGSRIEGPIDHLVTTAGGPIVMGHFSEIGTDGWLSFLRSKAVVQLDAVHTLQSLLNDRASVTLVSGAAGQKASAGLLAVGATNAAIEAAGRILAIELAPRRVNVISPGFVRTEAYDAMDQSDRQAMFDAAAASVPLSRIGEPEDIAALILAVSTNPNMTGAVLNADGGATVA